ncbi:hypothetical protein VNO77_50486 [Canavalia gladiata]|uniref:NADH-ubiquinone oxidoreductase chain 4L n=6 Tax=Phaseoleae TaxID=163735 RepID=A0AAN9PF42_CANGL
MIRSWSMMFEHVLILSAYLFSIGIYGLITSQNMVRALMCLELMLNAVNINFVTFSDFFDSRQLKGNIFSIFVIAVAAAEAAIGPAIVSSIYRNRKSTRINQSNFLNKYETNCLCPRTEDCVGCKRCESACPTDFLSVRVYLWHETTRSMGLAY